MNSKNKVLAALQSVASKMKEIDLGAKVIAYCIPEPIAKVDTEAIFEAVHHQLDTMPRSENDDLPCTFTDADKEMLENIQRLIGKISTQRQYNAALLGAQKYHPWRAMLSLIDAQGRTFCESKEEKRDMFTNCLKSSMGNSD